MLHFFPISALPPLVWGETPDISFSEAIELVEENLWGRDLALVQRWRWAIDLRNIRAFWLGEPLDERGRWDEKALEEALLVRDGIPQYVADFLDKYESSEERLRWFAALTASFYREMEEEGGFFRKAFGWERRLRLVLTALRAREAGRDLVEEFQFEEASEPLVAYFLAQKDAANLSVPDEWQEVKGAFDSSVDDPEALEQAIGKIRFRQWEELIEKSPFSVAELLSYLTRLFILESSQKSGGKEIVDTLSGYGQ
jgi:hypothetical protein